MYRQLSRMSSARASGSARSISMATSRAALAGRVAMSAVTVCTGSSLIDPGPGRAGPADELIGQRRVARDQGGARRWRALQFLAHAPTLGQEVGVVHCR